jgi:TetR/AcrR family transcriptional regulator, transcriptional repressor for nem operon
MLGDIITRAAELSDDPLQQMLIIMRLMAERYVEVPGGYAGCILASATYQDRLFDAEVKAANRRAHLAWRDRFRGHFERIAAAYPPREPMDAGDMADMVNAVIEGGMILARGIGDPQVLVRQVLQARQMVKVIYEGR